MKKIYLATALLVIIVGATLVTISSCSKNNSKAGKIDNTENTIFVNSNPVNNKVFQIGSNKSKVANISYNNSILKTFKESSDYQNLSSKYKLDVSNITKTYYANTSLRFVTIPIVTNSSTESSLGVYATEDGTYLVTKFDIVTLSNGNKKITVSSPIDGQDYFGLEINKSQQIGNWVFTNKSIPFNDVFKVNQNTVPKVKVALADPGTPCASQPTFNGCMNCFIIQTCGSSWWCTLACGAAIISCVGGAAAACALL